MKEWLQWQGIGLGLKLLAFSLRRQAKKDDWLKRALDQFQGVYRFESREGEFFRYLVFQSGKVRVFRNWSGAVDFTFTLFQPSLFGLGFKSANPLKVVIENRISQSGDLYYLYQFGFVMSLLERSFQKKRWARRMKVDADRSASH